MAVIISRRPTVAQIKNHQKCTSTPVLSAGERARALETEDKFVIAGNEVHAEEFRSQAIIKRYRGLENA